ncbi:MAG: hypothetical protein FJY88_04505 [Candidatus Eisenbacteria bacterium]|nr:hypothetical protein [Candidatus Eisenbacteria bacterium]
MNLHPPGRHGHAPVAVLGIAVFGLFLSSPSLAEVPLRSFAPGSSQAALLPGNPAAFWSQPPDLEGSKVSSEITYDFDVVSEVAEDFTSGSSGTISSIRWWGGPYNWTQGDPDIAEFNIIFYGDDGGVPSDPFRRYPAVEPQVTSVGNDGLGNPVYRYDLAVNVPISAGARYWLIIQADSHPYPPHWGRTKAASTQALAGKFKSEYFGHPAWVSTSVETGSPWDASMELTLGVPPIEACCFVDGSCQALLDYECLYMYGEPQGAGTDCSPNPCEPIEQQACCLLTGTCVLLPVDDCVDLSGVPQGPGSDCDPNPCPQSQACCIAGFCIMLTAEGCAANQGIPQGAGSDCDPNPCGAEACCFADGRCLQLSPENCQMAGGIAQGAGSDCDPNPCSQPPPEACCREDGSCAMRTPVLCYQESGTPMGTGTDCDPNPCPPPTARACCYADGHCEMLTESACIGAGGSPADSGTGCGENPCPYPVPVTRTTWGGIRAIFR